jgi:hypothetical protein
VPNTRVRRRAEVADRQGHLPTGDVDEQRKLIEAGLLRERPNGSAAHRSAIL